MRRLLLVVFVGACGFRSHSTTNGGDDAGDAAGGGDAPADGVPQPSCDAVPTWADGITPTATIYVSSTASGTEDGTQQHPYKSIANAMPIAPGTRVAMEGGVYPEDEIDGMHGTLAAPIWIEGPETGTRVQFVGGMFGIHLIRPTYVVLRHLDMSSQTSSGIDIDDGGDRTSVVAHHIVIADLVANNVASSVQLSGVYDVAIRSITTTGGSKGISMVGVHHASIARVAISGATSAGIQASAGSDDIEIRQSTVTSCVRSVWIGGDSTELQFRPALAATNNAEASNVRVFDNLLERADTIVQCSICTSSLVAANYVLGAPPLGGTRYVLHLTQDHGAIAGHAFVAAGGVRMIDNAISVSSDPYGAHGEAGTDAASCVFSHNMWYESDNPPNSTPNLPSPEVGGIYGQDPAYMTDGTMCASSAAAHAGVAVPEVPGTLAGACRPAPPSIGPSEPSC